MKEKLSKALEELAQELQDPTDVNLIIKEINYINSPGFEYDRKIIHAEPTYRDQTLQDYYAVLKVPYTKAKHRSGTMAERTVRLCDKIFDILDEIDIKEN